MRMLIQSQWQILQCQSTFPLFLLLFLFFFVVVVEWFRSFGSKTIPRSIPKMYHYSVKSTEQLVTVCLNRAGWACLEESQLWQWCHVKLARQVPVAAIKGLMRNGMTSSEQNELLSSLIPASATQRHSTHKAVWAPKHQDTKDPQEKQTGYSDDLNPGDHSRQQHVKKPLSAHVRITQARGPVRRVHLVHWSQQWKVRAQSKSALPLQTPDSNGTFLSCGSSIAHGRIGESVRCKLGTRCWEMFCSSQTPYSGGTMVQLDSAPFFVGFSLWYH